MPASNAQNSSILRGLGDRLRAATLDQVQITDKTGLGARLQTLRLRANQSEAANRLVQSLHIPMHEETPETLQRHEMVALGQHLARQDRWEDLARRMRKYDAERAATDSGMPLADLLAYGARKDVVEPLENALADPGLMAAHAPKGGLEALEDILAETPDCYCTALVVANAYIDIAWAWRGQGWRSDVGDKHWAIFEQHMARAAQILDRFDPFDLDSAALAATRCTLLAASKTAEDRVIDDYEDLIDLDPTNPRHLRALGNHLLPRWFGTYALLDQEARRTIERTSDVWGQGGYAWVYFDALAVDPGTLDLLDPELFLTGLRHILARRTDQHTANVIAAYTALTLHDARYKNTQHTDKLRKLTAAFGWILRDHLREVHPLVWGVATELPSALPPAQSDVSRAGRIEALVRIARHYERDLTTGARVILGENGVKLEYPLGDK